MNKLRTKKFKNTRLWTWAFVILMPNLILVTWAICGSHFVFASMKAQSSKDA